MKSDSFIIEISQKYKKEKILGIKNPFSKLLITNALYNYNDGTSFVYEGNLTSLEAITHILVNDELKRRKNNRKVKSITAKLNLKENWNSRMRVLKILVLYAKANNSELKLEGDFE